MKVYRNEQSVKEIILNTDKPVSFLAKRIKRALKKHGKNEKDIIQIIPNNYWNYVEYTILVKN